MGNYGFAREPRVDEVNDLMYAAHRFCSTLTLVVRPNLGVSERAQTVLDRLSPHLLERKKSSRWPGTELLVDTATVYRFAISAGTLHLLLEWATPLFDWQQPQLPEDLYFLREDGTEWLVTIAHERDAYLSVTPEELTVIEAEYPRLAALLVSEDSY